MGTFEKPFQMDFSSLKALHFIRIKLNYKNVDQNVTRKKKVNKNINYP